MTFMQVSTYSTCLKRNLSFNVLFPDVPGPVGSNSPSQGSPRCLPVLVLLHGFAGNHFDWLLGSSIQALAGPRNLVVVIPSLENHFYLDDPDMGELFGELVGAELLDKLASLFGLEPRRETTILGGYSMGGFGAIRNGLKYHQRYGGIMALSSALIHQQVAGMKPGDRTEIAPYSYYARVFGEPDRLLGSDRDPEALVSSLLRQGQPLPRLYLACGTQDFLINENRNFHSFLERSKVAHNWVETPGGHDFAFWNTQLAQALDWFMPLPAKEQA